MDMIQTNGPPVQAKPCDVHSLGMTLAMTMMEYGAFTDIGDHVLMPLLMVYCGQGLTGHRKLFRWFRISYSKHVRLNTLQTELSKRFRSCWTVAQLIHMIFIVNFGDIVHITIVLSLKVVESRLFN